MGEYTMLRFVQLFRLYRPSYSLAKDPESDLVNAINKWVVEHKVRLVEVKMHYANQFPPSYAMVTYEAEAPVAEEPVIVEAALLEYEE